MEIIKKSDLYKSKSLIRSGEGPKLNFSKTYFDIFNQVLLSDRTNPENFDVTSYLKST